VAWVSVCVIWGTTYLAIRIALETIPPALIGAIRYTFAGGVLLLAVWFRGVPLPHVRRWTGLALAGFLMVVVGNGAVIWAQQWVPSGVTAVTLASTPFWMIGVEATMSDGERLSGRAIVGLVIGFLGIVLLAWPDMTSGGAAGRQFAYGMLALQVACLGWALGSSYSRRHARSDNALTAAGVQMLSGGVIMFVFATARGEWATVSFTPRTFAAQAYLGAIGSLAGYSAYIYALKYLPVSLVSLYAYANPLIAVLLGTMFLAEPFGMREFVATAAVLVGITVVRRKSEPEPRTRPGISPADSGTGCERMRSDHTPAADQSHEKQNHGDDQQNPDEVPKRVTTDHPQ
jgi:drug/metabolite transporter (DMT)-like permease